MSKVAWAGAAQAGGLPSASAVKQTTDVMRMAILRRSFASNAAAKPSHRVAQIAGGIRLSASAEAAARIAIRDASRPRTAPAYRQPPPPAHRPAPAKPELEALLHEDDNSHARPSGEQHHDSERPAMARSGTVSNVERPRAPSPALLPEPRAEL